MKQFDYYEFTAILVPGAAFLLALACIFPDQFYVKLFNGLSFGDFGAMIIAAYVLGHLVQAFGNLFETIFWSIFKGMPTEWLKKASCPYLSQEQVTTVKDKIRAKMNITVSSSTDLSPITRQIYVVLKHQNSTSRIDIFNANYGLNRALAAGMFFCSVISLLTANWPMALILFLTASLLAYRMYDFAICYAREIFLEYYIDERRPNAP